MKKYILIYCYTNFTDEEILFWNLVSKAFENKGFSLFLLAPNPPRTKLNFESYSFIERLDEIKIQFFNSNIYFDYDFTNILKREKVWYGDGKKNRLESAKFQKLCYQSLIHELNPSVVVLGNGNHAGELLLKEEVEKKNIPIVYIERGCLPKTWHLDAIGITAGSSIAKKKWDNLAYEKISYFKNFKENLKKNNYTWWQQPKNLSIDIREKYSLSKDDKIIIFANQLDNDTSNFLYSPLFNTNLEAFKWFCKVLVENFEDYFVVFKMHPMNHLSMTSFKNCISELNVNGVVVNDIPLDECLKQCDLFCSVNSTSGYESMISKKPTLQLGESILSNKDIVYELKSIDNIAILKKWYNKSEFNTRLQKFSSFMNFMIKNELYFYSKDGIESGFKSSEDFTDRILSFINEVRCGYFPIRFIEIRNKYLKLNYKNIKGRNLIIHCITIIKTIFLKFVSKIKK